MSQVPFFAAVQILIFPQKKGMVTNMVTRVFVEKRKGFDVEARHMMADLRQNLGLKAIEDLRILNRYDVSGLSGEEFEAAARTILSEPNVDNVYDENYKDQQRISRLRDGVFARSVRPACGFRFPVRTALDAGRAPAGRLCKSDRR